MRFLCRAALLLFCLQGITACREQIQHGLDERQANLLQTVLIERGLDARKVAEGGKKPSWSVEVEDEHASDAVRILAELGLPRPPEESGCDVFGGSGLVRTPTEEQVCRTRVMERELEKTLQTVDGVLLARVHLVLPAPPRSGQPVSASKAAAMLRAEPGRAAHLRQSTESLKTLLAGGVEGLSPDGVSLLVDEVTTRVMPVAHPRASPVARLRILLAILGVVLTVLAVALVLVTLKLRHHRMRSEPTASPRPVLTPVTPRKAT
ncbi:flagellar M-ring protein FliF [Corallococcus sp. H22C18031201]|nr:flagellar M-ring protein FliF [Corallococcus sp. H22C18031201]